MNDWLWIRSEKVSRRFFNRTLAAQLSQILPGYEIPVCQTFSGQVTLSVPYINLDELGCADLPLITLTPSGGLCIHYPRKKDYSSYPKMHADALQKNKVITEYEILPYHHLGLTLLLKKPEEWLAMLRDFCKYTPKIFEDFLSTPENVENITRNRHEEYEKRAFQHALRNRDATRLGKHLGKDFLTTFLKFLS